MKRREIELHDSKVLSVGVEQGVARVRLSAYVRVSSGQSHTGWEKAIDLVIGEAEVHEAPPAGRLWILDGQVAIGEARHQLLELPMEETGNVRLELSGAEGRLLVTGRSLHAEEHGEARFIERVG